jgi:hypothetical protein
VANSATPTVSITKMSVSAVSMNVTSHHDWERNRSTATSTRFAIAMTETARTKNS